MGSSRKTTAGQEAAKSQDTTVRSRPEHAAKGKATDGPAAREARARQLERDVARESKR